MIYLASRSPRRCELLKQIGVKFEVIEISIDEHWHGEEQPHHYVQRMAMEKARAAKNKIPDNSNPVILAADTSVVLDGRVLGKAKNIKQAREMLTQLSGRRHIVYTAVAIATKAGEQVMLNTSNVNFRVLPESEIHSPVQMNVHVHCEVRLGGWNKGNERAVHHAANR